LKKRTHPSEAGKALMSKYSEHSLMSRTPHIDEQTLKKLPYWKAWLYKTLKEIEEERRLA